ncbi:transcriptional regulator [Photorhabdus luminescens]|uniref:Transcriptional regulator n=1 Tax=Photorhabdus akhurstii TaxID=171438 RepID=A0ABX8LZ56_9GAMM|nr:MULTISPECIES: helix-turn-helix domain-containing protein [Photorhabdus]KGM27241.1 transcriptional regulator [Photorhabdus luminescens]MBS9429777.1 helix-turn-helix domain-containing protein [Photorhabdus akhurstii]MBS9433397.1 helix-turn-helix domain-containing protein [Photorhabdus hainanensis]MCC8456390.1 helix-turn-helix domain-containing protein [Photorhabdus aegyptia]PQQ30857.1 transcriptional regulator [Photorhabdus luminescens]
MYHYVESGLSNIWLANGFQQEITDGEVYISIDNLDELHRLIAKVLVSLKRPLSAEEVRFLRIEMNMSQKLLSNLLGVDIQTIARWEKGQSGIPRVADVALRSLYTESIDEQSYIGDMLRKLSETSIQQQAEKLVFAEKNNMWQKLA